MAQCHLPMLQYSSPHATQILFVVIIPSRIHPSRMLACDRDKSECVLMCCLRDGKTEDGRLPFHLTRLARKLGVDRAIDGLDAHSVTVVQLLDAVTLA